MKIRKLSPLILLLFDDSRALKSVNNCWSHFHSVIFTEETIVLSTVESFDQWSLFPSSFSTGKKYYSRMPRTIYFLLPICVLRLQLGCGARFPWLSSFTIRISTTRIRNQIIDKASIHSEIIFFIPQFRYFKELILVQRIFNLSQKQK